MNIVIDYERGQALASTRTDLALVTEYEFLMNLYNTSEAGHFAFIDYYLDMIDYLGDEIIKRYIELVK